MYLKIKIALWERFTFFPLFFSHSSAVLDKFSTFLPVMATSAPSLQNKMAVPAPIPELAPSNKKILFNFYLSFLVINAKETTLVYHMQVHLKYHILDIRCMVFVKGDIYIFIIPQKSFSYIKWTIHHLTRQNELLTGT